MGMPIFFNLSFCLVAFNMFPLFCPPPPLSMSGEHGVELNDDICFLLQHSSRPREEQYLAKWASTRLHDSESLEQMVDPAIKKTFSSKALSRYADIISLCVQVLALKHQVIHVKEIEFSHDCVAALVLQTILTLILCVALTCVPSIQPVKEFRPPMSEIVDSLVSFSQKFNMSKSGVADGNELDPLERSFRTTTSRFMASPTLSYVSA